MGKLWQDVRYGWRTLRARPGFTFAAILALALGIGANTAIFSVVSAVLLRPLPYPAPERLVWLWENNPGSDIKKEPASIPNYRDWRSQNQSFEELTGFARTIANLTGTGEPERLTGSSVVANFFTTLRVTPMLGRAFLAEENTPGQNRVVVLSHSLWQRRFGGDRDIAGRTITLNGNPHTIVGVMPAGFKHPDPGMVKPPELWLPLSINPSSDGRRNDFLRVIGRLKPGVTFEQARMEMEAISARLAREYPAPNAGWTVAAITLHERFSGDVRRALWMLMLAVGFVLLIACANVANLLLARAASREREIAIRSALGAHRWRLLRQLLTESTLLALAGGTFGLLLAVWGVAALTAMAPQNLPRLDEIGISYGIFIFTIVTSLLTGIIFGIVPALTATRLNLNESLKESGRTTEGRRTGRLRDAVVIGEIAVALVLLVCAGLMVRSFRRLQGVDPGFRSDHILTTQVLLPRTKYQDGPQIAALFDQLLVRARALPGVETAASVDSVPLAGGGNVLSFSIEGRPAPPPEQVVDAETFNISPGFFATFGIPFVAGEDFSARDVANAPGVAIINETMARRYFPGEEPIGKRLTLGNPQTGPWQKIIGVVKDIQRSDLAAPPYPQMYSAYAQAPSRVMSLALRTSGDPLSQTAAVRSVLRSLDPDLPLASVTTMEQLLADSVARPRFNTFLFAIFAAVGLILAAVGIYGVISYSVTQRTHEIGIRLALGAGETDVLRLVLGEGLKLAVGGVATGLVVAGALAQLMASLLFGVGPFDLVTFAVVSALIVIVALVACYMPARRAMKVDPMVALRYE